MQNKIVYFLCFFTLLWAGACTSNTNTEQTSKTKVVTEEKNKPTEIATEKPKLVKTESINPLPAELAQQLLQSINGMELSFYFAGQSASLYGDNIQNTLRYTLAKTPTTLQPKKIIGHILMLKDGSQVAMAELSIADENNYIIYTIDKKKYHTTFSDKGLAFFKQMAGM